MAFKFAYIHTTIVAAMLHNYTYEQYMQPQYAALLAAALFCSYVLYIYTMFPAAKHYGLKSCLLLLCFAVFFNLTIPTIIHTYN